ncbi:nucleoporin NUP53, partial [Asbolus verrucosus]
NLSSTKTVVETKVKRVSLKLILQDSIMEPMALGSAPSSPSSPNVNPNFLPAFLMGDTSQPNTPNPNTSPGRNRTPGRKLGSISTPDCRNSYPKLFSQTQLESSKQSFTPHKPGPPSQGLFDTIEQKRKPTSPVMNPSFSDSPNVFGRSRVNEDSLSYSRNIQNLNESINLSNTLSRIDKIDTHWYFLLKMYHRNLQD